MKNPAEYFWVRPCIIRDSLEKVVEFLDDGPKLGQWDDSEELGDYLLVEHPADSLHLQHLGHVQPAEHLYHYYVAIYYTHRLN